VLAIGPVSAARTAGDGPGVRFVVAPAGGSPALGREAGWGIVFDGVLFDRDELAAALGAEGSPALDDAGLVARAYARWGEAALARIRGIFALVLWDTSGGELICARDPTGFHPLYYADSPQGLLISPSPTSLVSRPGVKGGLNRAGLVDYLARRWVEPEETYFSGVRRVPPGHLLRQGRDGRRGCRRYWRPAPYRDRIEWVPDAEVDERFAALLERAVRRSLSLGAPAVLLSGGLDSATVAAASADACRQAGSRPPLALSLLFPEPYGEEAQQRGVAEGLELPHLRVPFDEAAGADGIFAAALDLSGTLAAPLFNIWAPAYARLLRDARQRECAVILTGEGGDDLLSTPPQVAGDLLRSLDLVGLHRLWRTYSRSHPEVDWARFSTLTWRYGLQPLLREAGRGRALERLLRGAGRRGEGAPGLPPRVAPEPWIAPDDGLRREVAARLERAVAEAPRPAAGSAFAANLRAGLDSSWAWQRCEENFTLGRRAGVRLYDPLWDPDLADLLMRVRPAYCNRDGYSKGVLRRPLARRFPRLGFDRQEKLMLGTFISPVVAREVESALQRAGKRWLLSELGVVDPAGLAGFLERPNPRKGWRVWDVLNLEFWARAHAG
jgi:asparagine synthase (glutamine-hydrolysing)